MNSIGKTCTYIENTVRKYTNRLTNTIYFCMLTFQVMYFILNLLCIF